MLGLTALLSLLSLSTALPRLQSEPTLALKENTQGDDFEKVNPKNQQVPETEEELPATDDALFIFRDLAGYRNVDGSLSEEPKSEEMLRDLPMPHFDDEKKIPPMPFDGIKDSVVPKNNGDFLIPQPGVAPKFTGSFTADVKDKEDEAAVDVEGPISNPASYFLEGGDFEKVPLPKCQLIGCTGPLPIDGSVDVAVSEGQKKSSTCHQTFVPLNDCVDHKGYPMGMLCQMCCDCSKRFVREFIKTRGYKSGYSHE